MRTRPASPRITPLPLEEANEEQRELLGAMSPPLNIFATLARYPGLFRRWLPFGGKLMQGGKLPARDRELVILRVAWRTEAAYEWAQHVAIAQAAGLTDDEIERIPADFDAWPAEDAVLLRSVDELLDDHCIADETWKTLESRYSVEQMIELPMLAGHYALLAGALNSLGVQPERAAPALGSATVSGG